MRLAIEVIRDTTGIEVINTTSGGAHIEGTSLRSCEGSLIESSAKGFNKTGSHQTRGSMTNISYCSRRKRCR